MYAPNGFDGALTGNVTGNDAVGGLIGYQNGTVNNEYAIGTVVGSAIYVGGLAGRGRTANNS